MGPRDATDYAPVERPTQPPSCDKPEQARRVVPEEYVAYGYTGEDRHFVRAFQKKEEPRLTFDVGVEVVKLLMTAYQSAEQGKSLPFPPRGIEKFVPAVGRGEWSP